ncbi:cytochrome c biogenesis CcdA family protein [Ferrovibrio xuzhouensis]|uniref:Cytochrome c biogenesis CcdA family protein n=1 Tax=Ferrovibrio xuzhouensis TaxID=1576914 RepID=A0ABV7VC02_9PROT
MLNISLAAALVAGFISFLSPCVLPLVPGYVSYVAGRSVSVLDGPGMKCRLQALGLSLCFVLGFSTVFVLMGASATVLGQRLNDYRYEFNIVAGVVVIGFGLFLTGLIRPAWMMRDARWHSTIAGGHPASAYILGLAFAFGWTPCIGPILGAILTVGATSSSVAEGMFLLAVYSLGLGIPFLLATLFTDFLVSGMRKFSRAGRLLKLVAGVAMMAMGVAMLTGDLTVLSYWFLRTFPALSAIG